MQTIYLKRDIFLKNNYLELSPINKDEDVRFKIVVDEDITGWNIFAWLHDDYFCGKEISAIVESGLDGSIEIVDVENGIFILKFTPDQLQSVWYKAHLRIKVTDANGIKEIILNSEKNSMPVYYKVL